MGETGSKVLNQSSIDIGMFTEIKTEHLNQAFPALPAHSAADRMPGQQGLSPNRPPANGKEV